jgi:hypothetical protein
MQVALLRERVISQRVAFMALAVATVALALALRFPSLYEPRWYGDEGIFAAIAQNMRDGRTLYSEAWDNKPPLIFVTYALIQSAFGTGVMPLHAVTSGVVIGTQVAVMAIALRLYGPWRALAAGVTFGFVMCTPIIEGNLALTETYMILPATLAVLVFVVAQSREERRRDVWYAGAGLLLSVAVAYKQVAVFDAAAIATMVWLTHERPLRALAPFAAGLVVPQVVLLAVFAGMGALGDYWYAIVGSLGVYSALSDEKGPLVRFAGYVPALLVLAYLVRRQRLGGEVGIAHFPMLWLAFAFAGATSSSFEFPHYLQQAAPAAALVLVSSPLPVERDDLGRIALIVTGLLLVAIVFGQYTFAFEDRRQLQPVHYYRTFASHQWGTMSDLDYMYEFDGKVVAVKDISGYIDQDDGGETLFMWAEFPWVFSAAEVSNPTRYYTSFLGEVIPGAKPEIMRDLEASPPVYVVISEDTFAPFPELDDFVASRYDLLRAQGDWRLYRLSTATGQLTPERSGSAQR